MSAFNLVCFCLPVAAKKYKNDTVRTKTKEIAGGDAFVVKVTKQCDDLREEVERWNHRRIKQLRDDGYKGDLLVDAVEESRRFVNMLNASVEALELGETKREFWVLFLGDISESPNLSFVIRRSTDRSEISRHMIHSCI